MKAMLLAAGFGSRMGRLTKNKPKPLLKVGNKTLIEHQLNRLHNAGIASVIINVSYFSEKIERQLKYDQHNLRFSRERKPLETAGGVIKTLPLLGSTFLLCNSDIWCDHLLIPPRMGSNLAHLVMVPNPDHNTHGDFHYRHGKLHPSAGEKLTYSGIGWYRAEFFRGLQPGKKALGPLLHKAIAKKKVSAEIYRGTWIDVGTPERLKIVRNLTQNNYSTTPSAC